VSYMTYRTVSISTADPLALLDELAPLNPKSPRVESGRLTVTVDVADAESDALDAAAAVVARRAHRLGRTMSYREASQSLGGHHRAKVTTEQALARAVERGWLEPLFDGGYSPAVHP